MTVVKETLIYCDGGEDCPEKGHPLGDGDARDMVTHKQLKGSGWKQYNKKHYCPECKKKV